MTSGDRVIAAFHAIANGWSRQQVLAVGRAFHPVPCGFGSKGPSVAVISCVFASYHIYQGPFAVGGVFLLGLVHGSLFA